MEGEGGGDTVPRGVATIQEGGWRSDRQGEVAAAPPGGGGDAAATPIRGTGRSNRKKEPEESSERPESAQQSPESAESVRARENVQVLFPENVPKGKVEILPPEPKTEPPRKADKRQTALPEDFYLDEDLIAFTAKYGWDRAKCEIEVEKFKAYHQGNGTKKLDWRAAWRTWVLNGVGYELRDRGKGGGGPPRKLTALDGLAIQAAAMSRRTQ